MKKYLQNFKIFTLALGLMLTASVVNAADRFLVVNNGNWGSAANWSATSGGVGGAGVPGASDVAIIQNGFNVNVAAAAAASSVRFFTGGGTITVNATFTLAVTTSITVENAATGNRTATLAGAGTITCASVAVGGTTIAPNLTGDGTTTLNSTISTLTVSGNISLRGVDDGGDDNSATFNLPSGSVSVNGSVVLNEDAGGSIVLFDMATGAQSGTLTLSGATPFTNTGAPTFDPDGNTNTVNYSGAAQTVAPATYRNLVLSGSGAKTTTSVTVGLKLTLQGSATVGNVITYSTAILEYNGSSAQTTSLNEFSSNNADIDEVIINNTNGVTLNNATTLNGANLTLTSGVFATGTNLTFGTTGIPLITRSEGSITGTLQGANDYNVSYTGNSKTTGPELNNGGLLDVDINLTTGQTLSLDANRTPDGTVDIVDGIFDLSTFTFNRSAGGGAFNINDGGWLKIGGTNSFPTGYTSSTIGNTDATVEYSGTAQTAATLPTDAYTILILSGSGIKTLTNETVNELLSIQGTATTTGVSPTYLDAGTILEYKGSAAQTTSNTEFSGTGGTNPTNLRIDNTAGVTLLAAKTINGALTLTNGYLTTTTGNLLSIGTGGSATTANGAFVNGPLAKLKNTVALFTFPVGNLTGGLRTIGVTPSGVGAATYQASFLSTDPRTVPLGNVLGGTPLITQISACEYWDLARTAGTTTARVTVSWPAAANTCGFNNWGVYVSQVSSLVVGHHDGVSWKNEGQVSTTGSAAAGGTITSNNFLTTFSPFVLATTSSLNALPVTFSDVKAFEKGTGVQIEWSNLTEKDVLNYVVERSANGRDFTAISQLASRSNLSDKQSYLSLDGSPLSGTNYYRIKVVEIDGKVIYSKVLKVEIGKNVKGIILYPNPVVGSDISIGFTAAKGQYTLRVVNNAGQEVYSKQLVHPGGSINQTVTLPSALKTGVYNLMISGDNYRENKMFIMQ